MRRGRLFYFLIIAALIPSISYAQSIEGIINHTVSYLQGGLARTIGILCIIVSGYLCLFKQRFPKEYFMMILVGMGLIYGSSALYGTLIA